jgi:hypothetical protein
MRLMVVLRSKVWVMSIRSVVEGLTGWCRAWFSGCDRVLAGATAWALAGDHCSGLEQLTSPDTPRLPALESAGQALRANRTALAQGLGELHVTG